MTKQLIINNGNPVALIERTNNKDIKVVHLGSGIHATYHPTGHNHFFDPNSTRVWKKEIKLLGGHNGELVSCTTSLPFRKINDLEFFIGISPAASSWKNKYKKIKFTEFNTDNIMFIYLSGKIVLDDYVCVLDDEHPYVLIKRK